MRSPCCIWSEYIWAFPSILIVCHCDFVELQTLHRHNFVGRPLKRDFLFRFYMQTPSKHQVRCGSSSPVGEASDWCTNAAELLGPQTWPQNPVQVQGLKSVPRIQRSLSKMFQSCAECTTWAFANLQLSTFSAYQVSRRFPRKSALVALSNQTNPWTPWSPLISPRRMAPRSVASTLSPAESLEPEGISQASTGTIADARDIKIPTISLHPFKFDFETVDFALQSLNHDTCSAWTEDMRTKAEPSSMARRPGPRKSALDYEGWQPAAQCIAVCDVLFRRYEIW